MQIRDENAAANLIPTRLGPLNVRRHGGSGGPAIVLWHSLFLDGRSFDAVLPELTRGRTVFVVDGPGHGASPGPETAYDVGDAATRPRRARTVRAMKCLMLGRPSLVDLLGAIAAPTLFVASTRDPMWPPELAREQLLKVRRGRLTVLTNSRHVPSLDEPAAFGRLLSEWLEGVSVPQENTLSPCCP